MVAVIDDGGWWWLVVVGGGWWWRWWWWRWLCGWSHGCRVWWDTAKVWRLLIGHVTKLNNK